MVEIRKPVVLVILDGFGYGLKYPGNAIENARKPNIDFYLKEWGYSLLHASGLKVGLPEGQMGNSEVGHLNIGAGRVVLQDLPMINDEIDSGRIYENETLLNLMRGAKESGKKLHFMGLASKGGVHSHMNHLMALVKMAKKLGLEKVYIHAFTDGRDVAIDASIVDLEELDDFLKAEGVGKIATVMGRYYAMDRDNRWDRVQIAYDALTKGIGVLGDIASASVGSQHEQGTTDEFIQPVLLDKDGTIEDGDSVVFFNFRPDRARELTHALVDDNFLGFDREKLNLDFVGMTEYDPTIEKANWAYPKTQVSMTLAEYLSLNDKKILKIAETEKYAHVTFFFNGGREGPFKGEDRILIPSPKVRTYDLKPQMSAYELTYELLNIIHNKDYDLIVANYANPDMVGHTGDYGAAVRAIEAVDFCVKRIVDESKKKNGLVLLTADHGNAEYMINEDGSPSTQHTTNRVIFSIIGKKFDLKNGSLSDIAPTILELMGLEKPAEMRGISLIGG
ncbi:MAG: 2,3-bisphosphoglycerate-independent phosphoglycerate mutase [Tissierellia bacterium]|nr:2,3-bisphosphoglycerate-independent phosphoglycerate mutase [Tissierellia bacterium]